MLVVQGEHLLNRRVSLGRRKLSTQTISGNPAGGVAIIVTDR
jgi:hypothetical protein